MKIDSIILPASFTTTCKLCHRRVAEAPALEIPIIGNPGHRAEQLTKILVKHLTKHHAEKFQEGAALMAEMPAFLILSAFHFEDPTMPPRLENIRAAIFAIVQKNTLTDDSLLTIAANLGLDPEDTARVHQAMKHVRDACCEFGSFAAKLPAESKILAV